MALKRLSVFVLTVLVFCCILDVRGQNRRKAERIFSDANNALQYNNESKAIDLINKCLQADTTFADGWGLLGDLSTDLQDFETAVSSYKKALIYNAADTSLYLTLAQNELKTGRYTDAKADAGKFLSVTLSHPMQDVGALQNQKQIIGAHQIIQKAETAIAIMAHPLSVTLNNLGPEINTSADEYINSITADESTMIFTRKSFNDRLKRPLEELFIAKKDSAHWKVTPLKFDSSEVVNTAALCISPDGNTVWYTLCGASDGMGSCDLYISQRHNNGWSRPLNLGEVINTSAWETQPSISADGNTLYFVSRRVGGMGGSDIWVSKKTTDGEWGKPQNLGEPVNTPEDEMCPFIHPDGNTLYFASKGHPGMGGSDLFLSRLGPNGKWQEPVNLGYPINTYADEIILLINPAGDKAYISSTQKGGYGGFDIYSFTLPVELRPSPVTYARGIVADADNNTPLAADFELINLSTNKTEIKETSSADDGSFLVCLKPGEDYGLNVSRPGYLFYSQHFALKEIKAAGNPFVLNIRLQKIRSGSTTILNNIFFDTDSYALLDQSKSELERLVSFLKTNPSIKIKISGHTDNQGEDKSNKILSENRAKAVVSYLVKAGIMPSRLSYAGYGASLPIDSNLTDEGRARNRRTEFKIE
jgi:outer membrane protein OmpA-like peptidoglycan-associated protein/Tol biopolymer transport system component